MERGNTGRVALPYLRAWRQKRVMSREALKRASGVSRNTINALELGRTHANYATIGKLATGLGITPEQLIYVKPTLGPEGTTQEEAPQETVAA